MAVLPNQGIALVPEPPGRTPGKFWMYHPTNGDTPEGGRLFDPAVPGTPSRETLAAQGWADHPHKVGIPVIEGEDARQYAHRVKQMVDDGLLPRLDEQLSPEQVLRQAEELKALREQAAEREKEIEALRTQRDPQEQLVRTAREAKEQEADELSDAAREEERHLGEAAPPPNAVGEEKIADARSDREAGEREAGRDQQPAKRPRGRPRKNPGQAAL